MNPGFKILKGLPPYGKMYVPIPKGNWSEGLPVEFVKDDGTKWVANIQYGKDGYDYISKLKNLTEILIISNSCCYIIDRNLEKIVAEFGDDFKRVLEYKNKLILIGIRNIAIVENSKKIKHYDDLCLDFIENINLEGKFLSGMLNDYGREDYDKTLFIINMETQEFHKPNEKRKKEKTFEIKDNKKIKWWEIW